MTDILCDAGDKEVNSILFRVQQFLEWRNESKSIDIRLDALLRPN